MRTVKRLAAVGIATVLAMAMLGAPAAQAAPTTCPATFQVLHDDRIGALQLPAGPYRVTVFEAGRLSCARASDLFRQFLEDYDGKLPGRWRVDANEASFTRGGDVGFSVAQANRPSGGGGGRHPVSGGACSGSFHVLHNDRVGPLALPAGQYRITPLAAGRPPCARASTLFALFLQDYDGVLPGRWVVDARTGSFLRGSHHFGFRVKQIRGGGGGSGTNGGGGGHTSNPARCPGTFRVLHNDRVGPLRFPAGPYWVTLIRAQRQISCARASRLMTIFLSHPSGALPGRWVADARRGAFRRGNSRIGFRLKPAFRG